MDSVRESNLCFKKLSAQFRRLEDLSLFGTGEKLLSPFTLPLPRSVSVSLSLSPPVLLANACCAIAASGAKIKIGIGAKGNAH